MCVSVLVCVCVCGHCVYECVQVCLCVCVCVWAWCVCVCILCKCTVCLRQFEIKERKITNTTLFPSHSTYNLSFISCNNYLHVHVQTCTCTYVYLVQVAKVCIKKGECSSVYRLAIDYFVLLRQLRITM